MQPLTHWQLEFSLLGDWHIGNGREGGAYADALVVKDHLGLPIINGKSIKGLLRQAFHDAFTYGWLTGCTPDILNQLFGQAGTGLKDQGLIQLGNARLSAAELQFFQQHPSARQQLYRVHHSTAMNPHTGVAQEGSLRSMEVVIPLTLQTELSLSTQTEWPFAQWLSSSLPLIMAVGGKRRRGFGEVSVTAKELC